MPDDAHHQGVVALSNGAMWQARAENPNRVVVQETSPHYSTPEGNFWKLTVYSDFDESGPLTVWGHAMCIRTKY